MQKNTNNIKKIIAVVSMQKVKYIQLRKTYFSIFVSIFCFVLGVCCRFVSFQNTFLKV